MSKVKKLSFIFIFLSSLFCGLLTFNTNNNTIYAEDENIILSAQKVSYTDETKNLGEYTTEELYTAYSNNELTMISELSNNEVVALKEKEAILVTLTPKNNSVIQILNPSLTINGTNILLDTYQVNNSENRIFIAAYDFSSVKTIGENFSYDNGGYFNFTFQYNYSPDGISSFTEVKEISYYLIKENDYFTSENEPSILNCETVNETFYYYGQEKQKPEIKFNPYKFAPTINFLYNETNLTLTTRLSDDKSKVILTSSNTSIFEDKEIQIDTNTNLANIKLDILGKYEISYNLVFNNNEDYIVVSKEQTANLKQINQIVNIIGYEAYYKDYYTLNNQNQATYKKFFNENYNSNFSYIISTETTVDDIKKTILNEIANIKNEIAVTNQAPVKIISNITEGVDGAKYFKIIYNSTTNTYYASNENSFSLSNRFEEEGLFAVVIPYKFETYNNAKNLYSVIIFKIENETPSLNFNVVNEDNTLSILPENNFTNKNVIVTYNDTTLSPFSAKTKVVFYRDGNLLNVDANITNNNGVNSITFSEDGEYLVQMSYGIYNTTIERAFYIDKSQIKYEIKTVSKDDNEYNSVTLNSNVTSSDFAIFVENKKITSNKITVKYDYIALNNTQAQNQFIIKDDKLYIYNNYQLSNIYSNLNYFNNTLNNLESLSSINNNYSYTNNINAIITISALYKFTITDLSNNTEEFFILLDKTNPIVLETNDVIDYNNNETLNDFLTSNTLIEKSSKTNLISNDYSLIFGNYKALEFKIDDNNIDFAKKYFNDDSLSNGITLLPIEILSNNINYSTFNVAENKIIENNSDEFNTTYNILSIKTPSEEIEYEYTVTASINNIKNQYQFILNNDKNQIMIYGYDNSYYRVRQNSVTNTSQIFIRYIDESLDENFKLQSLKLYYYAPKSESFGYVDESIEFDLLSLSDTNNITDSNVQSGGFITSLINPTYVNGKYITKEGKYVIVKSCLKVGEKSQTFYVDRTSPLNYYDSTTNLFILDDKTISIDKIQYFINNNQNLVTNKLKLENLISNLSALNYDSKVAYTLNFLIIYNDKIVSTNSNYTFSKKGVYTIYIYDNANSDYLKANNVTFNIEVTNDKPNGIFLIDNSQEINQINSSTKSNSLKFSFEDSISEYLYDIDIHNIILKQNDKVILKTLSNELMATGYFMLDSEKIYYYSLYNNAFSLTRELIGNKIFGENRYKYTLTILDTNKLNVNLYENGVSKEAVYDVEISYLANNLVINEESFLTSNYRIIIDHTAPYKNIEKYINDDNFLTQTEKEQLLNSVKNKDKSTDINFENYAFVITKVPTFFDYTDTSSIYIRKYNKYTDNSITGLQSLVIGDKDYDNQNITRYRFDVNTTITTENGLVKLYTTRSYYKNENINENSLQDFFINNGYYEIIEIDEAQNYTIYTVLYLDSYDITASYSYFNKETTSVDNVKGDIVVSGTNLQLTNLTSQSYDYLDVTLTIQQKNNQNTVENLRYLPFDVSSENSKYFTNIDNLIDYVNSKCENVTDLIGINILIKNRFGNYINIQNNIPTEELDYESGIKDFEDRFVVTMPQTNNNTFITEFYVYPVINGEVSSTPLEYDSYKNKIDLILSDTFTFNTNCYNNGVSVEPTQVSIYYLKWVDNFERVFTKVKVIGSSDVKEFNFNNATTKTISNETYVYSQDVVLTYQSNLYSIDISYMLLPNTNKTIFYSDNTSGGIVELNLFYLLNNYLKDNNLASQTIKFVIELTDLTTLINSEQTTYTLSYIYYPNMPSLEFTDSASNTLDIHPISLTSFIVSTSKNVSMNYTNNTLFGVNISAIRTYIDEFNVEKSELINNINNDYTFTDLGYYEIIVVNELQNSQTYKFRITPATQKTYQIVTNESNMTNFEILPSEKTISFTYNDNIITADVYYSIYNTIVEANSDFNLIAEKLDDVITTDEFDVIWQISKVSNTSLNKTPYKYIAIKKIVYNSNFLNAYNGEETKLKIKDTTGINDENLADNLTGYSITSTKNITLSVPLYNEVDGNTIFVKVYYNNNLVTLNANIYSINETENIQTIKLVNVPAGVYSFYFEDLAGNIQTFTGNTFLNIVLLNEIAININNSTPIDYQIFNSTVNLTVLEQRQYNTNSLTMNVTKNGEKISNVSRDNLGNYIFNEYGFYKIEISAITKTGETIYKTTHFTILNKNIAYKEFSFISLNGQNISKILKNGSDVTNDIKKFLAVGNDDSYESSYFENSYLYNINLASVMKFAYPEIVDGNVVLDQDGNIKMAYDIYNGNGVYEIFVDTQNSILEKQTYSFKVWIRDENVKLKLNSSIKEGGKTSKAINFSYNGYLIYSQIGECKILVNDEIIVEINSDSENKVSEFTIPKSQKGTFIVQIKSDDNTELSFVVNKTEPLSTVSIVVIVLSSLFVAGLMFMFIKLRRKIKVK